jgi:hypothetical protein
VLAAFGVLILLYWQAAAVTCRRLPKQCALHSVLNRNVCGRGGGALSGGLARSIGLHLTQLGIVAVLMFSLGSDRRRMTLIMILVVLTLIMILVALTFWLCAESNWLLVASLCGPGLFALAPCQPCWA